MVLKLVFLLLIVISVIRTVAYGVYCMKNKVTGGLGVFLLALGVVFCGVIVVIR